MRSYPVNLEKTEDVVQFVQIVNRFDCDVDLKSGSVMIDAKSLMGALYIAGKKYLELIIHSSDSDKLAAELGNYLCA